jgi:hypothetical protein
MTISANYSFDLSTDQLVTLAYRLVLGPEVQVSPIQLSFGRDLLNTGCKALQNEGVELRTRERYTQALTVGVAQYSTPGDTIDVLSPGAFVTSSQGTDLPLETVSMADYMALSLKTTQAQPTQLYVEKGTATGLVTLTLYPVPDGNWASMTYPRVRLLRDFDTGAVTGDFPSNYLRTLQYMLAADLAESHGLGPKADRFRKTYELEKSRAVLNDGEKGPARFVPDYGPYHWGYRC